MLLSAVVFPCVAAWWIAQFARQVPSRLSRHWLAWDGILAMGLVLGWSLLGGLHVAALMASRSYLMGHRSFRREGGAAAAHCFCCAGAALRSAAGDCGGLAEKLAAHSVGGAPVRRDLRRLPAAVGGLVGALFGLETTATGWRRPFVRPRSKAFPGGALPCRCSCGPAGRRCCSSSSSAALGCVWSAFPWSTPSATGWRRWGVPDPVAAGRRTGAVPGPGGGCHRRGDPARLEGQGEGNTSTNENWISMERTHPQRGCVLCVFK